MRKLLVVGLMLLCGNAMANGDWLHQQNVERELDKIERHLNEIEMENYKVNPGPARGHGLLTR